VQRFLILFASLINLLINAIIFSTNSINSIASFVVSLTNFVILLKNILKIFICKISLDFLIVNLQKKKIYLLILNYFEK